MKRRLRATYGAVAVATLAASVVLMACEPSDLGAARHAEWSAAVDLTTLSAGGAGDAGNGVQRARLAPTQARPRS